MQSQYRGGELGPGPFPRVEETSCLSSTLLRIRTFLLLCQCCHNNAQVPSSLEAPSWRVSRLAAFPRDVLQPRWSGERRTEQHVLSCPIRASLPAALEEKRPNLDDTFLSYKGVGRGAQVVPGTLHTCWPQTSGDFPPSPPWQPDAGWSSQIAQIPVIS